MTYRDLVSTIRNDGAVMLEYGFDNSVFANITTGEMVTIPHRVEITDDEAQKIIQVFRRPTPSP